MILIDANILIYAHVTSFAQHKLARDWLDRQLNASAPVGLPWASVLGFLRLVTNPRVFERPESIGDAWQQVRAWFASDWPGCRSLTERHADLLANFSRYQLRLAGRVSNVRSRSKICTAHRASPSGGHGCSAISLDWDRLIRAVRCLDHERCIGTNRSALDDPHG